MGCNIIQRTNKILYVKKIKNNLRRLNPFLIPSYVFRININIQNSFNLSDLHKKQFYEQYK